MRGPVTNGWHGRLAGAGWRAPLALALLGTVLLLAPRALAPVRAADQPATATAPAPTAAAAKKPKTYQLKAGPMAYDAAKKMYHFSSSADQAVVFTQDDVTMTMDQCDYDDEHQTAVGTGHLKITDPESTITGDKLQVDFNKKFAQIIGNVTVVTQKKRTETAGEKPATAAQPAEGDKPAGEKQGTNLSEYREKKTTITCPQIDYYYADDKKQAAITGPVKAVQEDKTVVADQASYDGVKDTVVLDGNVTVTTEKGDEFHFPTVTISLKDNSFEAPNGTGVVIQREEKPAGQTGPTPSASPEQKPPAPAATPVPAPAAGPHG